VPTVIPAYASLAIYDRPSPVTRAHCFVRFPVWLQRDEEIPGGDIDANLPFAYEIVSSDGRIFQERREFNALDVCKSEVLLTTILKDHYGRRFELNACYIVEWNTLAVSITEDDGNGFLFA
jgi:hypothetical protein